MPKALEILQKYWKHDTFRWPQNEIIDSVLNGNDTFALMPTGGGKSICFQVPAMMQEGICLVISPLVALMKDQVANLQQRDIRAIALTGGISSDEMIELLDNCQFGNYKFLYLSSTWVGSMLVRCCLAIGAQAGFTFSDSASTTSGTRRRGIWPACRSF